MQEVTRTANGVIGICDLSSGRALSACTTVTATVCILAMVAQEALVVGSTALPAKFAGAAS